MASKLYQFLASLGYHHPFHPVLTHLPVGLTVAAFIFLVLASILKSDQYLRTARHCVVLALLAAVPTAVVGYLDWQQFYGGAGLTAIKIKIALAGILMVLLLAAGIMNRSGARVSGRQFLVHGVSVLAVAGLGYFGGELVYGPKAEPAALESAGAPGADAAALTAGATLFQQKCSFCHYTDRTETKVGPGLKDLFKREKMSVSGWPMTPESVRRQLNTPFKQMPPFDNLTDQQVQDLIDYLKSL